MVQVQVGEQDGVDLLRAITGGLHVRREHAGGGADALAGAGVHQDQLLAGVDQKGVEGGLYPRGLDRAAGQQGADLALGHALEQLRRQVVVAIEQRRHFVVAHRQAVVTGYLGALDRRLRLGAKRCQGQCQGCSAQRAQQRMRHAFTF